MFVQNYVNVPVKTVVVEGARAKRQICNALPFVAVHATSLEDGLLNALFLCKAYILLLNQYN